MSALCILAFAIVSPSSRIATAPQSEVTFLDNARIVVKPGTVIESGDILIKDGVIAEIGTNLTAPAGAKTVDCKGLTAYPGFIHPFVRTSLRGISAAPAGGGPGGGGGAQLTQQQANERAAQRDKDPFNYAGNILSGKSVAELTQDDVSAVTGLQSAGYSIANITANGGVIGAPSSTYALESNGISPTSLLAKSGWIPITPSRGGFGGGGGGYPGSTMGGMAIARQGLADADRINRLIAAGQAKAAGIEDAQIAQAEAMKAARPVFDDLTEITFFQAKKLVDEFGLKPIYAFRSQAAWVTDLATLSSGTVMLKGEIPAKPNISSLETASLMNVRAYFNELQAAAELVKRKVDFCYSPTSTVDPLGGIRSYVQGGLSKDAALAALTTKPAAWLGIGDHAGTLEKGKWGNVTLVQGDVFEPGSQVMATFARGKRAGFEMPAMKKAEDLKPADKPKLAAPNYDMFPLPAESKAAFRLYRNATVWTQGPKGILSNADVLIQDGKIVNVGRGLTAPRGAQVIDATGLHISPGIYDCHSHTGISGSVNEGSNMVTIECRIADVMDHRSVSIYRQLSGGTVGAQQLHGSANAIGGQSSSVKWQWGERATSYPIADAPAGVKFALGQNPIREDPDGFGGGVRQPDGTTLLTWRPRTRMGVEEAIRRALQLGKEYNQAWDDFKSGKSKIEPRRDLQLEGLGEIVSGKRMVHSHGYRADEMLMLLRVVKEFGGKIATLQHVLEGYKIADEMAKDGVGGSTFSDWWGYKLEAYDAIPYNAALMADRGVSVSVNSDSDNHARRLNQEAAKSMRYGGISAERALSFVTIEPARQMGIAHRTGSIEVGKDADLAIWTADPTSMFSICVETYVDGVKRYDRKDEAKQLAARIDELKAMKALLESAKSDNPFETGGTSASVTGTELKTGKSTAKFGIGPVTGQPGTKRYPRKPVLIKGAMVHTMTGAPQIGDVLIDENGKITALGLGASASITDAQATVINGAGKHLYPGLIDPSTTLGLAEIGQVPTSDDSSEKGNFHPDYRIERTINPEWDTLGVARQQGVLTAIVRPGGSGVPGQAALIHTEGFTYEDLAIQSGAALVYTMGGGGGFGGSAYRADDGHAHDSDEEQDDCCGNMMSGQGGRRGQQPDQDPAEALATMTRYLKEARDYAKSRADATAEKPVARDQRQEAVLMVAEGKLPVMIAANSARDMKAAVAWAEKENVRIVLYGCSGAGEIIDWLADKQVPICLAAVFNLPSGDQPVDYYYNLPARLAKAGVKFCLTTNDAHNVRLLRDQAGWAAAYGLDREEAARIITLRAAEVLGIDDRLGAIKVGLDGTIILTDGEITETKSQVLRAWIQGREVELTNRQTRLYDKYRNRPKP